MIGSWLDIRNTQSKWWPSEAISRFTHTLSTYTLELPGCTKARTERRSTEQRRDAVCVVVAEKDLLVFSKGLFCMHRGAAAHAKIDNAGEWRKTGSACRCSLS